MLVAMAMSAIVLTSIYTVYTSMMSTTVNETNLVDMQQELRIAIGYMSRDIKMAGAIIPDDFSAIDEDSAPTDETSLETLKMNTLSSSYTFAIIDEDLEVAANTNTTTSFTLTIVSTSMLGDFSSDDTVRIIRPGTQNQVGDSDYYTITYVADVDDVEAGSDYCQIKVAPSAVIADELSIKAGDVLVPYSTSFPETIKWSLDGTTLERQVNGDEDDTATIIENVSSLSFEFLDEDGVKFDDDSFSADDIAAVIVTLAAVTNGQLDNSERERELSTIVYLRN
jgi:Tfp pilus assembly protein PilW